MFFVKVCRSFFFLMILLNTALSQQSGSTATCSSIGLLCASSTSFVICSNVNGQLTPSTTEYSCPSGYSCDDSSSNICQLAATTTNQAATTTQPTTTEAVTTTETATTTQAVTTTEAATTTEATTTDATTTTVASTTPTETTTSVETTTIYGEPDCTSTGNYPGPTCSQYYECVYVWWWYAAALRTCDSGLYYSQTKKTCVTAAESGCTP